MQYPPNFRGEEQMSSNTDVVIDEKIKITIQEPSMYKVIFLNDDKTPMDFVVELLIQLFRHTEESARNITLQIHSEGSGVVGTYSYEIAEQKGVEATKLSRSNGFPLTVKIDTA